MSNAKTNAQDKATAGMIMKNHNDTTIQEFGVVKLKCFDEKGNLKWEEEAHNALTKQGQEWMLKAAFGSASDKSGEVPVINTSTVTMYVGLLNTGASPSADSTLASPGGTESTGTNYSRKSVTFTVAQATNWSAASSQATWTAGAGGWTAVTHMFLGTTASGDNSGRMIAWVQLLQSRTLAQNDVLNVTYTISVT